MVVPLESLGAPPSLDPLLPLHQVPEFKFFTIASADYRGTQCTFLSAKYFRIPLTILGFGEELDMSSAGGGVGGEGQG